MWGSWKPYAKWGEVARLRCRSLGATSVLERGPSILRTADIWNAGYTWSQIYSALRIWKRRGQLLIFQYCTVQILSKFCFIFTLWWSKGLKIHKICLPANNLNLLFQGHTNAHNASHHQGSRTTWRKCGDSECYDKMINWSWLLHLSQPCQPFPQTPSSWSLDSQVPVCKGHSIRIHEVIILDKRKKERKRNVLAWACLFPGSSWSKALIYLSAVAYSCNNHKAIAIYSL